MMMMVAIPLALGVALDSVPTAPIDYYTGVQGLIVSASGEYAKEGAVCCAKGATGCVVSTQAKGWDVYQQGSRNRSIDTKAGVTLTWAAPVHKVMALQPGSAINSSHKYACAVYCPHKEDIFSDVAIAPEKERVQSIGSSVISQPAFAGGVTKNADGYRWTERLFHILPLNINTMYVDPSTSPPTPFKSTSAFTQFIIKATHEPNSTMNKSFIGFDSSFDVASELDVDMDSVHACKLNKQCSSSSSASSYGAVPDPWRDAPRSLADLVGARLGAMSRAEREAVEAASDAAAAWKPPAMAGHDRITPVFAPSYTATKKFVGLIAEGSTITAEGDACCSEEAPACVVQSQHSSAVEYQDVDSKKVRTEHGDGQIVVDDYTVNKTMLVVVKDGVETCDSYCPIPSIIPLPHARTLPDSTVDGGQTVLDGQTVELYEWKETFLKFITMSTTRFYARILPNGTAVPVFESKTISPFGHKTGTENLTWTSFIPGRPPAAKFEIAGIETCPESKHCQSPIGAFYTHRRITGQTRAWEEALFAVPPRAA